MWLVLLYGSDIDEQGLELLEEKQQQGGTMSGWPEKARLIDFVSSNILFYLVTEKRKSVQLPVLFVNICQSVLETILTTVYIQPGDSGTLLPQLLLFHLSTSRSTWSSMKLVKVKVGTVTSNKTHISVCIHKKCTNLPTTQMLYDMCIGNHQLAHLGIC